MKQIPGTYKPVGVVYRCCDTGNMIITEEDQQRMLVVSEAEELMKPTKPCVQLSWSKIWNEIFSK
jgi:hypothetical protein